MGADTEETRDGGFGIYVHWPFCQAKCPYCDFNSHVSARVDQEDWLIAFQSEIERYQRLIGDRRVGSVYFGGGTPSLMEGHVVRGILDSIRAAWTVSNDWEVTLEANPTSVEAGRFAAYREAGVNRVSLGVQALRDEDLRRLGRLHSVAEAMRAFDIAQSTFERVSFDLIYARQDQTLAQWEAELARALDRAVDHLSLYQLTVEPGTAFWDRQAAGGLSGLPEEDLAADMYDTTVERCRSQGLAAYEVSNFARAGAESIHNMMYWSKGEYLGIGPGAHGRVHLDGQRWATEALRQPGAWLASVRSGANGPDTWTALGHEDQRAEYLMMGLRTTQGIRRDWVEELGPHPEFWAQIHQLVQDGYLNLTSTRIKSTPRGRIVLNAVLRDLLV